MTRLYQSFSIELTLAVVLAFGLVAFRIGRTLWKGKGSASDGMWGRPFC